MKGFKPFCAGIVALLLAAPAMAASPSDFVSDAVDTLARRIDGRKNELSQDSAALYALIDEILLPRFDRRMAAQQVLAKHWRSATAEQQERFINSFYTILIKRYADGILDFEHDRIKVLPFRGDDSRKTVVVKTQVDLEDGSNVSVNYTLVKHDSGWMMFDVTIEGVSYVRNFRAEFESEIRATSLEQVIARLESEAAGGASE